MRWNTKNKAAKAADHGSLSYWKGVANFKCSNDTCGFDWWSVHEEDHVTCGFCNKFAKTINVVDDMMDIAVYTCTAANCGNQWKSIRNEMPQECDVCGAMVSSEGTQTLFGRHFWISCKFKKCPAEVREWEDFSLVAQPTQRCRKCKSRGDIVCFKKHVPKWVERQKKIKKAGDALCDWGPGDHDVELDICYRIRWNGKRGSRYAYRKAEARFTLNAAGRVMETIISVSATACRESKSASNLTAKLKSVQSELANTSSRLDVERWPVSSRKLGIFSIYDWGRLERY